MKNKWHQLEQKQHFFDEVEVTQTFPLEKQTYKLSRRADVMLRNHLEIIEYQHSNISRQDIEQRTSDWAKVGIKIHWVINGTSFDVTRSLSWVNNEVGRPVFLIGVRSPWNKLADKFQKFSFIFIQLYYESEKYYVKIRPNDLKMKYVYATEIYKCEDFIHRLNSNDPILRQEPSMIPCNIILKQMPPGSGKTFGMLK